jgi:hypothetical protein
MRSLVASRLHRADYCASRRRHFQYHRGKEGVFMFNSMRDHYAQMLGAELNIAATASSTVVPYLYRNAITEIQELSISSSHFALGDESLYRTDEGKSGL